MRGALGAVLGILGGIATALAYVTWTVRQIRRTVRAVDRLADEHAAMLEAAHRHEKYTGRVVRLVLPRGGHRAR